jgi:universal stress protein E
MRLLKKILLPVNPEYYTKETLNFAIQLAKLYQSAIMPIHVIGREAEFKTIREIAHKIAEEHINKVQSRIKKEGINTLDPIIDFGNHFDRIAIAALKYDVNVILFGIRIGAGKVGSTLNLNIEKVIRHCDKPVWAVKEGRKTMIKKILCPVDFSEASKRAVLNAIHISQKFNAKITLLSVYTPLKNRFPWFAGEFTHENKESYSEFNDHFKVFLNDFNFSGSAPAVKVRTGAPDQEILLEIKEKKHDLLIMGSTGRTALGRVMTGSVTEKVIRQAPCSFITTKSEDMIDLRLETKINTIEHHYNIARHKQKSGLLDEAMGEYFICLSLNDMHIASLLGLSEIYGRKGMEDKEALYKQMAVEIINRLFKDNISLAQQQP